MSRLTPNLIDTRQLFEQVYDVLKEQILTGRLRPGERVSIRNVAKELDVSVTPVRDAVNRLANDGFVIVRPRSGVYVAEFSADDVREMYEIRLVIEPEVARQTVLGVSEDWLREARRLAEATEASAASVPGSDEGDPSLTEIYKTFRKATELDGLFHLHLLSAKGNRRLIEMYRTLHVHWRAPHMLFRINYSTRLVKAYRHLPIVEAYESRDPDAAAEALRRHLTASLELHRKQLSAIGDKGESR